MIFSYENLEIWQLGMKLVELVYSFKDRFLAEDKFGLWDQLVRAVEAVPRDIAEGYGKSSKKERALYMERAKTETIEVDASFKEAVKKGRIRKEEYENLVKPLIKELYFKIIAYRKWILGAPKRSDQPTRPSEAISQAKRSANSPTGFTLIEILMVVFLLGIIVVIGSNLFFSILKGASKAEITKEVKQNGDYAMNVMERHLRNANSIESCGEAVGAPEYVCWYRFPPPMCTSEIQDPEVYKTPLQCQTKCKVKAMGCPFDCSQIFTLSGSFSIVYYDQQGEKSGFTCREGEYIASGSAKLTSDNVTVKNCSFSCDLTKTPPIVNISFDLSQKKGTGLRPEEKAQAHFQTTVGLRTY